MPKNFSKEPKLSTARSDVKEFCGLAGNHSDLELAVMACAKLGIYARGDIHANAQIIWIWHQIKKHKRVPRNSLKVWKNFYSSAAWKALRYRAFSKHGNKCQCCGRSPLDGAVMHVDHILPKSTHPHLALNLENLQILCDMCNIGKSNQSTDDWRISEAVDDFLDVQLIIEMNGKRR